MRASDPQPQASVSAPDGRDTVLLKLYEENGKVAAVFWEWRHKIMSLCTLTVSIAVSGALWLIERGTVWWIWLPCVFGAGMALACRWFDRRIAEILSQCYERGSVLEEQLIAAHPWVDRPPGEGWIYHAFFSRLLPITTTAPASQAPQPPVRASRRIDALTARARLTTRGRLPSPKRPVGTSPELRRHKQSFSHVLDKGYLVVAVIMVGAAGVSIVVAAAT